LQIEVGYRTLPVSLRPAKEKRKIDSVFRGPLWKMLYRPSGISAQKAPRTSEQSQLTQPEEVCLNHEKLTHA
jgi:hypothetical protein